MKQKHTLFLSILFSFVFVTAAYCEQEFSINVPLEEGKVALADEDYPKAIESFRKVLFIDGTNLEASFHLASALEKNQQPDRSLNEYRRLLSLATKKVDSFQDMSQAAQEAVLRIEEEQSKKGSKLTFFEVNVLFLAFIIILFAFYSAVNWFRRVISTRIHNEKSQMGKLLLDSEWLSNKKKELVDASSFVFSILFSFVALMVVGLAVIIIWSKILN